MAAWGAEHDAVRPVVLDFLEGMIWSDEAKLRRAFRPDALQVGHFAGTSASALSAGSGHQLSDNPRRNRQGEKIRSLPGY